VLMGQSNSVGRYTLAGAMAYDLEHTRFKVFNLADNLVDYDIATAVADTTGSNYTVLNDSNPRYSMGPALMNYLARRVGGKIVCIPCNRGGTDITTSSEWGERTTDFDTDTLFGATNTRINLAISAGISPYGVAYQQGEADAHSDVAATQSEYDTALDTLIDDVRDALDIDDLYFSVGVISDDLPDPPHTNTSDIQAAQVAFTKTDVTVVDTSDSTNFPTSADNIHYNDDGLEAAGEAHAAALFAKVN